MSTTPTPTFVRSTISCGRRFMQQPDRNILGKRQRPKSSSSSSSSIENKVEENGIDIDTSREIISLDVGSVSTLPTKALEATKTTAQDPRVIAHYLNHTSRCILFSSRNVNFADEAKSTKTGLVMNTSKGNRQMNGKEYAELVKLCKPDIVCALAATTYVGAGNKRVRHSVDATMKYLEELLTTLNDSSNVQTSTSPPSPLSSSSSSAPLSASAVSSASTSNPSTPLYKYHVFAAIVGGVENSRERQRCVGETLKIFQNKPSVLSGYVLAGFACGETASQRKAAIENTLLQLPSNVPRMIECITNVFDVLDAISMGIDIIQFTYPDSLTDACCAAIFHLEPNTVSSSSSSNVTKICLRDASYARDTRPLVEGCQCYACKHHTRAYIHHLIVSFCYFGCTLLSVVVVFSIVLNLF
jgi:queuine/archaeosine tRNA-ribosyltransferase